MIGNRGTVMPTQKKISWLPADDAGPTLADVSARSGLAIESLSRLETGVQTNPIWKTLGAYAAAVGRRPRLIAETVDRDEST